uniref:Uncharacterized protein n=1 Tax=Opuntia streptacantha TaxID=393608 RepID=A0A7C9DAC8_OPUST
MDLGFIGFIPGILMLVNGAMGSITGLVFNHVLMVAAMLGSSSVVLSMGLVATISEMAIDMLGSILVTRSMDLVSITLLMGTVTRAHGTKAVSKGMECTPSEVGKPGAVNGTVVRLKHPYGRLQIQCSKQFRQPERQQRMQFICGGWMIK